LNKNSWGIHSVCGSFCIEIIVYEKLHVSTQAGMRRMFQMGSIFAMRKSISTFWLHFWDNENIRANKKKETGIVQFCFEHILAWSMYLYVELFSSIFASILTWVIYLCVVIVVVGQWSASLLPIQLPNVKLY